MTKIRKIAVIILTVLCSIIFLGFVFPYTINVCTNHRLHYRWIDFGSIFRFGTGKYKSLGYTPNKKYALHLVDWSWQGNCIVIEATRKFSYHPTEILELLDENLNAPTGPLKKDFDIICSKDSRYIAIIRNGWFIDFYDFDTKTRNSLNVVLVGEITEENMNKWKEYHNRISEIMGDDYISVVPDDSNSR